MRSTPMRLEESGRSISHFRKKWQSHFHFCRAISNTIPYNYYRAGFIIFLRAISVIFRSNFKYFFIFWPLILALLPYSSSSSPSSSSPLCPCCRCWLSFVGLRRLAGEWAGDIAGNLNSILIDPSKLKKKGGRKRERRKKRRKGNGAAASAAKLSR